MKKDGDERSLAVGIKGKEASHISRRNAIENWSHETQSRSRSTHPNIKGGSSHRKRSRWRSRLSASSVGQRAAFSAEKEYRRAAKA